MFEKDAEERGNEKIKGNNDLARCSRKSYKDGFKEGAEFGYNKANEWHYVKDGDLPKDESDEEKVYAIFKDRHYYIVDRAAVKNYEDLIAWTELPTFKRT